jgi:hypothetical protein
MGHNAPSNALLLLSLPAPPAHKATNNSNKGDSVVRINCQFSLSASRALFLL